MQIECIIKRIGGTRATLDGKVYHFKPISAEPGAPHVCEVRAKEHIARFLSITDAYQYFSVGGEDDDPKPEAETVSPDPATPTPETADGYDAVQAILADPAAATDDQARAAFAHLENRQPHGKAKTKTIVQAVIQGAARDGLIEEGGENELLAQLDT